MFNGIYTLEIDAELVAVRGSGSADLYDIAEERINALNDDMWAMNYVPEIYITSYNSDGSIIWQEAWIWEASLEGRGYWFDVSAVFP